MRYPSTSIASELSLPCMYASLRNILAAVLLLTSVHGRREDKLLYVPVHVGGHGPYWFAVDSGAHNSVIDPFIVDELGLTVPGTMTTKGTGEGDVPVRTVAPLDMRIGDVTLKIAEPWVIDLSGVPIPKWVHGRVGAELFEAHVGALEQRSGGRWCREGMSGEEGAVACVRRRSARASDRITNPSRVSSTPCTSARSRCTTCGARRRGFRLSAWRCCGASR